MYQYESKKKKEIKIKQESHNSTSAKIERCAVKRRTCPLPAFTCPRERRVFLVGEVALKNQCFFSLTPNKMFYEQSEGRFDFVLVRNPSI